MDRRPTPAHASSPLPSLDAVRAEASPATAEPHPALGVGRRVAAVSVAAGVAMVAGGVVYSADAPVCGAVRADELVAHGASATQSLRRGDLTQTLQELGRALGWVSHGGTTVASPPNAAPPSDAPEVPLPETVSSGEVAPVGPWPRMAVQGGIFVVEPVRPAQHVRRAGGVRRVHPLPDPVRR